MMARRFEILVCHNRGHWRELETMKDRRMTGPKRIGFLSSVVLLSLLIPSSGGREAPSTPEELASEIDALRVEKVAWREIQWKTCLLDGLTVSREEDKPLMLWIFIDRPVDDKRC